MREILLPSYKAEYAGAFLSPEKYNKYTNLVTLAKEARAYPDQSGFFVRTAGLAKDGTTYSGGNKEYAHSDAFIHGETAVLSGLGDITNSPVEAIAWYKNLVEGKNVTSKDFGRPCGNCRDILSHYCGPDLALLNGNETGIVHAQLKDYLFTDFHESDLTGVNFSAIARALNAADRGVDAYLPEHLKKEVYGATLVSSDGKHFWSGSLYSNAGYDAVTPVMSSIITWLNSDQVRSTSKESLNLSKLVIAGRGKLPNPFYRDRQAILEIDEILRRFNGDREPIQVEIIQKVSSDEINVVKTDVAEWLPNPFSAGVFGMNNVLDAQLVKLIGESDFKKLRS